MTAHPARVEFIAAGLLVPDHFAPPRLRGVTIGLPLDEAARCSIAHELATGEPPFYVWPQHGPRYGQHAGRPTLKR